MNVAKAIVRGNQPPWTTLARLAAKKVISTLRKTVPRECEFPLRPAPESACDREEEDRVDHERAGDRDAVGGRESGRGAEADGDDHDGDEEQPVDDRDVDLSHRALRRLADRDPRQEAELHRLARDRVGARDHRLRGDDRRDGREHDHRDLSPARDEQEERVRDRLRVCEDQAALAEVVERQRGEDEQEPGARDRDAPEVAHIGVEGLGAGDREHDGAHRDEGDVGVAGDERVAVARREALEDRRVVNDPVHADGADRREPDRHHRPEEAADALGAPVLDQEEPGEQRQRDRHHEVRDARGGHLEALDRREDRDRRGDHAVAVEERGTEHAEGDERRRARRRVSPGALHERAQRHDPALAVVVRAHDEGDVLDRDDERDRPEDERDDPVDVGPAGLHRVVVDREDRLQRVERARADVAEDDAERAQHQPELRRLAA